jgi:hypothetical protein
VAVTTHAVRQDSNNTKTKHSQQCAGASHSTYASDSVRCNNSKV